MPLHTKNMLVSFLVLLLATVAGGCNPEQDALKLFSQQGLTVLKPARSYIALGGIFVVPKSGTPVYLDPYDSLPTNGSGANPFQAVIMQQSSSNSTGLAAAVGTLGGLVPVPAGAKFSNAKQVQLAQIDATGNRYTSQEIAALIHMTNTANALNDQLPAEGKNGNRVFVVQEIYTGKSLSLKSSDNTSLAAAVFGSVQPQNCSSSSNGDSSAPTTGGTSTSGAAASGGTTTAGADQSKMKPGTASQNAAKSTPAAAGAKPSQANNTGGTAGSSNVGVSVGMCWADAFTLSFQSQNAIPFAVRLNEVTRGTGDLLQVKITNFKVPTAALGAEDVSATALIAPDTNVLTHLIHKRR